MSVGYIAERRDLGGLSFCLTKFGKRSYPTAHGTTICIIFAAVTVAHLLEERICHEFLRRWARIGIWNQTSIYDCKKRSVPIRIA